MEEKIYYKDDKKRKWDFIVKYGVLGWGISSGILFSLIFPFAMNWKISYLTVFILSMILFPAGGLFWGYFMWKYTRPARE